MRLLVLLLLFSCSTSTVFKFKYSSSNRLVASGGEGRSVVAKIEGRLKDPHVLASGMDSTFLIVTLYDSEGNILTDIDPHDLTLSTSVDIEAKPFVRKHGIYKAEILPRVKSSNIKLRVDWKETILSDEIILQTVTAPKSNELRPLHHDYFHSQTIGEIEVLRGSSSPEQVTEGFSFENIGNNKIVNTTKHSHDQRSFTFHYPEQARQNISLEVEDSHGEDSSQTMRSLFMFFPRKKIPVIEQLTGTLNVTLPNSEKMIFQKKSKEIVYGVFSEGPLIHSEAPTFPDLKYRGKGIVLRANAQEQSPQIDQADDQKIDMEYGITGQGDVLIMNGASGQRCRRPKTDFWDELEVSPIEFKFPTDEAFDQYLKKNCGFGLPKP